MRKIYLQWFFYENLTDYVKIDCKVAQLILMRIHFLAQKTLLIKFLSILNLLKLFSVANELQQCQNLSLKICDMSKNYFQLIFLIGCVMSCFAHEHLSSTHGVLIIVKHGNQGRNISCEVSINSSTRPDFNYAYILRNHIEQIFNLLRQIILKIA